MCALELECWCSVRLGAVLVPRAGAAAVCAWELGWWCRCRVSLLCALVFGIVLIFLWVHVMLSGALWNTSEKDATA